MREAAGDRVSHPFCQTLSHQVVCLCCRRLKCDGGELSINCETLPAIENFVSVALSLQRAMNIPDSEFRVFVAADQLESYLEVQPPPTRFTPLFVCGLQPAACHKVCGFRNS